MVSDFVDGCRTTLIRNIIFQVAHQMITNRPTPQTRGYTVAAPADDAESISAEAQHYNLMARRGSKSMPTTPLQSPRSSPTSRRRKNGNR